MNRYLIQIDLGDRYDNVWSQEWLFFGNRKEK